MMRSPKKCLKPRAVEIAALDGGLGEDLDGARLRRQMARLIALDRCASQTNLLAELLLDHGLCFALASRNTADTNLEQTSEYFVAHGITSFAHFHSIISIAPQRFDVFATLL